MGWSRGGTQNLLEDCGCFLLERYEKKNIESYTQRCEVYQQNKYQALKLAGLLQPLPIPTHVW